jgi:polar amino acid transport system ATP-binding protein
MENQIKLPDPTEQPLIQMEAVEKWYGSFQALQAVTLSVRKGEKIVLCGPSMVARGDIAVM